VGVNGSGKTNLLDAIHYLSMTKSAFSSTEGQNVKHGEQWMMIAGIFEKSQKNFRLTASYYLDNKKKTFAADKKEYDKISEHIGLVPSVMICPDDSELIKEGSEIRRKFFDSMIAQLDKNYLQQLIHYHHALQQRNTLLKQFHEGQYQGKYDLDILEPYSLIIKNISLKIFEVRQKFVLEYLPLLNKHYQFLTGGVEFINLKYESDCELKDFELKFNNALQKDLLFQRTTLGVHKDDFVFLMNDLSLKKFGSQGQQKSYLVALKLAQFEICEQKTACKPILLLDDIFDKLDDSRIAHLLDLLNEKCFGQVFITDARPERSKQFFDSKGIKVNTVEVNLLKNR
jgi:DNA replication and repair protein RecF